MQRKFIQIVIQTKDLSVELDIPRICVLKYLLIYGRFQLLRLYSYSDWWKNMDQWWNDFVSGKSNYSQETCLSVILFTTNPTWTGLGADPWLSSEKPAINLVSYNIARVGPWKPFIRLRS